MPTTNHSIGLPHSMDYDDSKFYDDEDGNMFMNLACRVVGLRALNRLIPEAQCRTYQQLIRNEQKCGGCVPISTEATDQDPAPELQQGPTMIESVEVEGRFRFSATLASSFWLVALMVVAGMMMASLHHRRQQNRNFGLQEVAARKEFELPAFPRK